MKEVAPSRLLRMRRVGGWEQALRFGPTVGLQRRQLAFRHRMTTNFLAAERSPCRSPTRYTPDASARGSCKDVSPTPAAAGCTLARAQSLPCTSNTSSD